MNAPRRIARLSENLAAVRERIAVATAASGRAARAVRLVAVTKYVDAELAAALATAGCHDLGESRPQELWKKSAALPALLGATAAAGVRWHLIGHLQRNKAARTLPLAHLIHSVDSQRLLTELAAEAQRQGRRAAVLLEVNVSGDAAKTGFSHEALTALGPPLAALEHVDVLGLMAMSGLESDAAQAQREFAEVRLLRDRLRDQWQGRWRLDELSMGMSGDFEQAIAEGATLVRIGSALFEGCL